MGGGTDIELKHPPTGMRIGKWDVDTFLESDDQPQDPS
jgi:hypothetical protein